MGGGDPAQTLAGAGRAPGFRVGDTPAEPHLVQAAAVLGQAPELALQVDDAGFPPDHLDPHLIVLLLQLTDLFPVLVLFDQAL